MERAKGAGRAVSNFFSGVVGVVLSVALALLGIIGTVLTAADLLDLSIDPGHLLFPAAAVIAGNVAYREAQRRRQAEGERDAARAALDAKLDEAAIVRLFLALHDEGPHVLEPFHEVVEQLRQTMPIGEQRYADWIARCTQAIEAHRPAFALRFRQAQAVARGRSMFVIVKDDEGKDRWVDIDRVRRHEDLVGQSMAVLALIVNAG